MFWVNFNDWLAYLLDSYPTYEYPGDLYTYDEVTYDEDYMKLDEEDFSAALPLIGAMP